MSVRPRTVSLLSLACLMGLFSAEPRSEAAAPPAVTFSLVEQHPRPVISRATAGAEHNKYGFEGGHVLKRGGTYHLFVSEMIDNPKWAKTRLGHWTSPDRIHWTRQATLFESSGEYQGQDPRAALFLPQPIYNEQEGRWNLFYAAFRSAPNGGGRWLLNHEGRIWRAVSTVDGPEGLGGPYQDAGVILEPGADSDQWEGLQGVDSFFPYRVGDRWYGFYGSAHTQKWPCDFWGVGLASAPTLAGPWKRCSELNPALIDKRWVENLHVVRLPDGVYAAVYDATPQGLAIGYTSSRDGLHWAQAQHIRLSAGEGNWLKQPRTPLSLIPREDGNFEVFFTGNDQSGYGCVSWMVLKRQ